MSRAAPPRADTSIIVRQLEHAPGFERLRALDDRYAAATAETVAAVLDEAARFATDRLDGLNARGEHDGAVVRDGGVRLSDLHRRTWHDFVAAGWISLDLPEEIGGQALPLALGVAVQEVFDRSCPAFGMLAVPIRSAVRLIGTFADPSTKAEWLPKLVAGEWAATICISEPRAGSDVARIRTLAEPDDRGAWRVTGEKQWITFGHHDLTDRIGHCLLARTPGGKGLSLFLVPNMIDGVPNHVHVRRIEEKLGLHLSPTCALGFEGAHAILLGQEGRGLAQMFVMITSMRMAVAAMGLGIASGAADVALAYAEDRIQGGAGPKGVAIIEHADVQRQLLGMHSAVEVLRGLILAAAVQADLSRAERDDIAREDSSALAQWLLPIIKTLGGETAFAVASDAIQVLGGAGYTTDWPVEQSLRDARVLPVFEGTTGIQALDLLHRRLWRDAGAGLRAFETIAHRDLESSTEPLKSEALAAMAALHRAAAALDALKGDVRSAEAGATAFLELAGLAALGWIAVRLASIPGADAASARLRALGAFWLQDLSPRAALAERRTRLSDSPLEAMTMLRR